LSDLLMWFQNYRGVLNQSDSDMFMKYDGVLLCIGWCLLGASVFKMELILD